MVAVEAIYTVVDHMVDMFAKTAALQTVLEAGHALFGLAGTISLLVA
jgi:hypothetical protein